MFDLNKKIRYENLAPSLQAMFGNANKAKDDVIKKADSIAKEIDKLLPQISDQNGKLNAMLDDVNKKFNDLRNKINAVNVGESSTNDFNNEGTLPAIVDGFYGQFAKVNKDKKSILAHDGFEELKICTNQEEFDRMTKIKQIDLEEVFRTWYRYAHYNQKATSVLDRTDHPSYPEGQNLNYEDYTQFTDKSKGAWRYDKNTKEIRCTVNSNPTAGFIIPYDGPTSWMIRTRNFSNYDDDNFMIIVGYMKDSNGVEHTLSVARGAGMEDADNVHDTKFLWGLLYDMGNSTQFAIVDLSNIIEKRNVNTYSICYLTVIKNYDMLECRTSHYLKKDVDDDASKVVDEYTFKFTIPDTKPNHWSQEMYDNIKIMLRQTSRVGFGSRSVIGKFKIDKQSYIFDDDKIYRLDTDEVYDYNDNSSSWVKIGKASDYLMPNTFMYNKIINKFVYYLTANNFMIL